MADILVAKVAPNGSQKAKRIEREMRTDLSTKKKISKENRKNRSSCKRQINAVAEVHQDNIKQKQHTNPARWSKGDDSSSFL